MLFYYIMGMVKNTDILIVGSGIAGLSTALMLPSQTSITLITKASSDNCSTSWAQGGIASVLSETDSFEKHINDTVQNGGGIVDKDVASTIIKEGPSCINWLKTQGVSFTQKNDKIDLTQAEAIADLIDASSQTAARMAVRSLQGEFSQQINKLVAKKISWWETEEATLQKAMEIGYHFSKDKSLGEIREGIQQRLSGVNYVR